MKINQIIEAVSKDKAFQDIENVFFGDIRGSKEKDTRIEKELYDRVEKFIRSGIRSKNPSAARSTYRTMRYLIDLKPHYPNELVPNAKKVYRGTQTRPTIYLNNSDDMDIKGSGWIKIPYTYQPRSAIQSWTTKIKVAEKFALNGYLANTPVYRPDSGRYGYPCIIEVNVDNNFVFTSKLMNLIGRIGLRFTKREFEIIRASNAPIQSTMLIKKAWIREWNEWSRGL